MYLLLLPPILGVLAQEFDVSVATLGVAIGVQALVNTAFQMPYGYLADAFDRTLTLTLCLLVGGFGVLLLAVAPTFEWLLLGQVVVGIGVAGHHPAHYPLLSDATPESNRGRAFSVHGFAGNIGFAAPAAVIVAITALPGLTWRHAFAFMGLLGLAYAVLAAYVLRVHVPASIRNPAPAERSTGPNRSLSARLGDVVRELVESPAIVALGVFTFVAATVVWGLSTYVVTFLEQGYGVESSIASLTLTAMYGVGALFVLVGGDLTDRFGPGAIIVAGYSLAAVAIFLLASAILPPMAAVVIAVLGGSLTSFTLPARDKLTDLLSARADLGRNFAIITVGYMLSQTVAPPLFGALIDTAGYTVAFGAIAATSVVAVGLAVAIVVRWHDDFSAGVVPSGT